LRVGDEEQFVINGGEDLDFEFVGVEDLGSLWIWNIRNNQEHSFSSLNNHSFLCTDRVDQGLSRDNRSTAVKSNFFSSCWVIAHDGSCKRITKELEKCVSRRERDKDSGVKWNDGRAFEVEVKGVFDGGSEGQIRNLKIKQRNKLMFRIKSFDCRKSKFTLFRIVVSITLTQFIPTRKSKESIKGFSIGCTLRTGH